MSSYAIAIIITFFISGIPGVLFSRMLVAIGSNRILAVIAGSLIIPIAYLGGMVGFHFSGLMTVAWVGPLAAFAGGVTAGSLYFASKK
ncbi:MAG: hypothetical protein QFC78_08345 [Pseudomonadota bacterium]|nr:hypothetical protein [Pseudomonadota bacterium]